MSKEINHSNLVYDFKGQTPSINFAIFGGPMYMSNKLKNGEKTWQPVEEDKKKKKIRIKGNIIRKSEA